MSRTAVSIGGPRLLAIAGTMCALIGAVAADAVAAPQQLDAFGAGAIGTSASSVALSPAGDVYVTDTDNHRVQRFTPAGTPAGTFAGLGAGEPRLNRPVGVAVDAAGTVYVTESQGDRLHRFTDAGEAVGTSGGHGSGPGQLDDPAGVAVAADGAVLVADAGNARVQAFAPTGAHVGGWGQRGTTPGAFLDPYGIAVAPNGDVFVTDRTARRVQRFTAGGAFLGTFDGSGTPAGALVRPTGITVDRDGAVHVADAGRNLVVTFSPDGDAVAWGAAPPLAGPAGLATDCRASVYVVDAGNGLVRRFGRAGAVPPPCSRPTAAFTPTPATVLLGAQVYFDGSASSDDGRIVRMDWDLDGDGVFEAADRGPTVTRSFDRLGGMPVGLRVTDDDGEQDQVTSPVTVVAPAPPVIQMIAASTRPGPVLGVSLLAERVSGAVRFRRAGGARTETLGPPELLPIGTRFDTTAGRVRLTLATDTGSGRQTGTFWDGIFTAFQGTDGPLTELVLAEPPSGAPAAEGRGAGRARAAAKRRRKRSRLWGDARGDFRTTGRNAAATVRGTRWLVEDDSAGWTAVQVATGSVSVRDAVAGRTVVVRAGRRYVARDRCTSRRRFSIRLRVPVGVQVRSADVRLGGRRMAVTRRAGRLISQVDLRGRPEGRQIVRITLVTTTGVRIVGTRPYRTCDDKRSGGAAPRI